MVLPRFVAIKSNYNNKYLRYIKDGEMHGFLQFSGEEVVSPYVKFEVQKAKSGDGLVHIRCCYNNKYLRRQANDKWWMVAAAEEPVEEQSDWSCTLFRPFSLDASGDGTTKTVRFCHVQLGHYACLWRAHRPFNDCLYGGSKDPDKDKCDIYTIIDWESLMMLPKYVAFKGDNGKYLSARWVEEHQYLQFAATDLGDQTVVNEVFTNPDGSIRIKNNSFGKFWRRSPNWIWADNTSTNNSDPDTLFWPMKVDKNVVALKNLGNNCYCKGLTTEGKIDCLNAAVAVETISTNAHIRVEEPVISREISNVIFDLKNARIYNESIFALRKHIVTNENHEPIQKVVKFSFTETTSTTWNVGLSLKVGVETKLKAGIPLIADGEIRISGEISGEIKFGETKETKKETEDVTTITVQKRSKVTVSLMVTKSSYDIPFSYSQRDTLTNGNHIKREMEDGVFTGVSMYITDIHVSKPEEL